MPEATNLQLKKSGKPSRKQTLKRRKVRVTGQQMSGRGSRQGAKSHKSYILCNNRSATDLLDMLYMFIRTLEQHTPPSLHYCSFSNTFTRVTVLYKKHAEENSSKQRSKEVTWPCDLISHKSLSHRKSPFKNRPEGKGGPGDVCKRNKKIKNGIL